MKFIKVLAILLMVIKLQGLWVNGEIQKQEISCYFIFGDSVADNGNNNFLVTTSKANYFPYGIDFPAGNTGRFTNGQTIVDIIGRLSLVIKLD